MNARQQEVQEQIQKHYGDIASDALNSEHTQCDKGCGRPLSQAQLKPGETVLDLGCGSGIDVVQAAQQVGETGYVYGLDMTPQMLELARRNILEAKVGNAIVLDGRIEEVPLADGAVDVVISNCVINLSGDKEEALREAYRVLKAPGRFVVADIVAVRNDLPPAMRDTAVALLGCTNGVLFEGEYLELLRKAGFSNPRIVVYRNYPFTVIQDKAKAKGRDGLLDGLDGQLLDGTLAAAYVFGTKSELL
jgi:ubiquinone/menaquinone biosynthesis C-methylase UbiE